MKSLTRLYQLFLFNCLFIQVLQAQQIDSIEYFINSDQGFGKATGISTIHAADISTLSFGINTTALNNGFNNLYVRSHSSDGKWSLTNRWVFFKDIVQAANVSKLEYFIDTDPGFGNATDVAVPAASDINSIVFPVTTTALNEGFHAVFIRSRDNNGSWSISSHFGFFKEYRLSLLNVKNGEYFFDTDPGFGHGTIIPFTNPVGNNIADFSFAADLSALNNALHYLFVRTLDSSNRWSITNVITFTKNVALPVTWLSFTAMPENKFVLLEWKTAFESNSSRFEIERSINSFEFNKIGSVNAAGNSTSILQYSFTDNLPFKGINYYRLKQIDLDGLLTFSEIRKVEMETNKSIFILYNNPSNGTGITVRTDNTSSLLSIFTFSGQKLKEIKIINHIQLIDLSGLPSGTYTAVLNKEGSIVGAEKIVIVH